MQQVGLVSYQRLRQQAGVSDWQVRQLRQGRADQLRGESLVKLSAALQISLGELLRQFSAVQVPEAESVAALRREYQRLEAQLADQRRSLQAEFQQTTLQALESWLLQWPTAAYAAQQNPQVTAVKLLPLVRPIEQLLRQWGVEAIAPVGVEIPYDPQWHQLMEGTAQPGALVKVRYTGYSQGEKLWFRAKVSPV